ncbi:MAG: excinuclease ABC subunit UvrA [Pseudomonadales bacterium]|jgi:excinuclease ABC subunit A|nr:excinuclease ABC subunit UvrA [Pseudomonadales bacterium]
MSDNKQFISVRGAKEHNLQNIDVDIPKNKLVVFTGLSGSGKSSLAFDTLYSEGQRRYVESLSSYARMFLGIMKKPDVDQIIGLSPAIAIDQKTTSHNPRSTVGTITEIYDYLRLLFAKIGHQHCPQCGREVSTQSIDQIIGHISREIQERMQPQGIRLMILSPIIRAKKGEFDNLLKSLRKKGYLRVRIDGEIYNLNDNLSLLKNNRHTIEVVIDRLSLSPKQFEDGKEFKIFKSRLTNDIEEALRQADGFAVVSFIKDQSLDFPEKPKEFEDRLFSEKLACSFCAISLDELSPQLFSFNSPTGACPTCSGLGSLLKIDQSKIVAESLSLSEGAIIPFERTVSNNTWWSRLVQTVAEDLGYDFRKTAWKDYSPEAQKVLLYGSKKIYHVNGENRFGEMTTISKQFEGFINELERRYQETDSDFIRRDIGSYMKQETCPECKGKRLRSEALAVTVDKLNIAEVVDLTIDKAHAFVEGLKDQQLSEKESLIAAPIIKEVAIRLGFLLSVGLEYLTLSRQANTLAGGEAQRIRLASQIGTGLTGVVYILDEPTIGLHQRDNLRLIDTLKSLRDKGNSVIVVEHDRDVINSADMVYDFGPQAGKGGGKIVAEGTPKEIVKNPRSETGKYLAYKKDVKKIKPKLSRESQALASAKRILTGQKIKIKGATANNLKNIDVDFPLGKLNVITGVSGSGKSTLLYETLYLNLATDLGYKVDEQLGPIKEIDVPLGVKRLSMIDQSPIGKTPRSNPATYTKIFDYIRKIFADTMEAKVRGYTLSRFSFNIKGGRCEACQGDGQIKVEMQFLPDIYVPCDVCSGKRYNEETLQIIYRDKNIADVLGMTVDDAYEFFDGHSHLRSKMQTLRDVGLGYITLGQSATTLSGGEAQRVKLAKELSNNRTEHIIYLLDEPTTGLHFADVQKLLNILSALVAQNNTVILIEHNLDIIKNADHIIDLGPEGGEKGGQIVVAGTPEQIVKNKTSWTAKYLASELIASKK